VTTENSDWATNCPEYKVTAVEVVLVSQKEAWEKRTAEERSLPRPARKPRKSKDPAPV
jgi:formate dehydrogenase major subunit